MNPLPTENEPSHRAQILRRIKTLTWIFIIGLVVSGATAIPLSSEINTMVNLLGFRKGDPSELSGTREWILKVQGALNNVNDRFPFLFYGTDWLAFGHFVIAIAFIGALRDPVRNRWLFTFGLIACGLVIPFAFVFGAIRGIPFWWRLIDCSFGIVGAIPLGFCAKWARTLEALQQRPESRPVRCL